jgi:DNA topoisomerase III
MFFNSNQANPVDAATGREQPDQDHKGGRTLLPAPISSRSCTFEWDRDRLFDHTLAAVLFERIVLDPVATVCHVEGRQVFKEPPHPLSTLELQKRGTTALRLAGERIMKLAEELYQGGFVSYPRTETDRYSPKMDLVGLIAEQRGFPGDEDVGHFADRLVPGGGNPPREQRDHQQQQQQPTPSDLFRWPPGGGHDDQAHPPIHPTKCPEDREWSGWPDEKKRVYTFIVRSFLASCARPAVGFQTVIQIEVAREGFRTKGLMVQARNYLEVYPYASWGGNDTLPLLEVGDTFRPSTLDLRESNTQVRSDDMVESRRHTIILSLSLSPFLS